ncbi:MAG: FHA domain-containing protein [Planctomycetes bacterium]|nr:FHA domain-containing protein [Planctomycetota bacterium]
MARIRIDFQGSVREMDLTEDVTVFGRGEENSVVLDDKQCSRKHCHIEKCEGKYKLVDLESRNGTKVNGSFVNQRVLQNEDMVEVGTAKVTFLSEAGEDTEASPVRAAAKPPSQPVRAPNAVAQRTPASFRTPPTRRPRSNSTIGAVVTFFVLALIGAIAFFMTRRDPAHERALAFLNEANDLISKRKLAEALKVLREIPPDAGEVFAGAKEKIEKLEKTIDEEKRLREAQEQKDQYEEIRKFAFSNPDKKEDLQRKVDFFRGANPGSPLLKELDALLQGGVPRQSPIKVVVPGPGGGGPGPGPGPGPPPGGGGGGPAVAPGALGEQYKVLETTVGQFVSGERFGQALLALDEFIKKNPSAEEADKAQKWRGKILDDAELFFTTKDGEARKLIKERKFAEAKVLYQAIINSFGEENSLFERKLKAEDELKRIAELEKQK